MRLLVTINSIFHAPERCLGLALAIFSFGVMAMLSCTSAATAAGQAQDADPKRGQDLFQRRCTSCHSLDAEKEGPRLRGVFGRKSASVESFNYSDALKGAKITWDAASLDKWLTDTDKFIPDNDMNLSLKNPQERADIIAYLKQLSSQ
jgi:cytochrome c